MSKQVSVRANGSKRVSYTCEGASRVEQDHRERVNINTIVAKARRTGFLPFRNVQAEYGDFSAGVDFHTAQNRVIEAQARFQEVPSKIRKRFENDPGKLLDFLMDENNREEAIALGLIPEDAQKVSLGVDPVEEAVEAEASKGEAG